MAGRVYQPGEGSERRGDDRGLALSGSSARKLERGGANLLAGRAVTRRMFPLTAKELDFDVDPTVVIEHGLMPLSVAAANAEQRENFLRSYLIIYVNEEVKPKVWFAASVPSLAFSTLRRFARPLSQLSRACPAMLVSVATRCRATSASSKTRCWDPGFPPIGRAPRSTMSRFCPR